MIGFNIKHFFSIFLKGGRKTLNSPISVLLKIAMLSLSLMGFYLSTGAQISVGCAVFFFAVVITAYFIGYWLFEVFGLTDQVPGMCGVVPKFALGAPLLAVGILLFSLLSPLSLLANYGLVVSVVCLFSWSRVRHLQQTRVSEDVVVSETFFMASSLLLVFLWCLDLWGVVHQEGGVMVLRVWRDVYFHMTQISALSNASELRTLSDVQMAASKAHPYHIAAYVLPATLNAATAQGAWSAYAGLMLPLGLLLTSFAAYTLAIPWFGRPGAICAGLGLLLLPDAAQMGFGVPFLGYHWLQQVGPAGMYGTASAAMAFCMMMIACKCGRWGVVVLSYLFMLCTLLFKAQIFVAIAYPLLIFPALYFPGASPLLRAFTLIVLTGFFAIVVAVGQSSPNVPLMRLDGSSLWEYSQGLLDMQLSVQLKSWLTWTFDHAGTSSIGRVVAFSNLLLLCTFGVYLPAYLVMMFKARYQQPAMVRAFPLFVVAVYLVMSVGMAFDDRRIGMPEELLHRPFVWAYFVIVTFMLGNFYHHFHGESWPKTPRRCLWWIATVILLLLVPSYFSRGIQTMPSWDMGYQKIPLCMWRASEFVRYRSQGHDVVQKQDNDVDLMFSALVERQPYAANIGGFRMPSGLRDRLKELAQIDGAASYSQVAAFFRERNVKWYVATDLNALSWSRDPLVKVAFVCENIHVLSFYD